MTQEQFERIELGRSVIFPWGQIGTVRGFHYGYNDEVTACDVETSGCLLCNVFPNEIETVFDYDA